MHPLIKCPASSHRQGLLKRLGVLDKSCRQRPAVAASFGASYQGIGPSEKRTRSPASLRTAKSPPSQDRSAGSPRFSLPAGHTTAIKSPSPREIRLAAEQIAACSGETYGSQEKEEGTPQGRPQEAPHAQPYPASQGLTTACARHRAAGVGALRSLACFELQVDNRDRTPNKPEWRNWQTR